MDAVGEDGVNKKIGGGMKKRRGAMAAISPELFVKTWQEGESVIEVATHLGIPPGNASSRARFLRERLGVPLKRYKNQNAYGEERVAALKKLAEDSAP